MKALVGLGLAVAGLALVARPERPWVPTGRVGRYWTWEELTVSATAKRLGLANVPTPEARRNLEWMVREVLDPLRTRYGRAVRVTSGYRAPTVNRVVGGVAESKHLCGLALDLVTPEPATVGAVLHEHGFRVLHYPGHLHVEAHLASRA